MDIGTRVRLNDGSEIPRLGLGVFRAAAGGEARRAVAEALKLGYRHVDTAGIYGNEADVGEAIRASGIPRDQIFVTTKLWNDDHGHDQALRAFDKSLKRLGLDHVDLYLIHWPVPGKRLESWKALERIAREGRARSIGVSNFLERHLDELLATATIKPAVNQIEIHPFLQRRSIRAACAAHGIVVEAYSPLTKGRRLAHPAVSAVARRVGRTPAQVLIRWGLQHDLVTLPKSARPERIAENAAVYDFELDAEAMKTLDGLEEGLVTAWDPASVP